MPRTPQTRQNQPPEVRRAQILAAALHCFSDRGYHAATMDDLARASGLSKGSLYWHFESKEEVFLALFDQFAAQAFGWLDEEAARRGPVLEAIGRAFGRFVEGLLAEGPLLPAWMEFLAHPLARDRFAGVYAETRSRLAALIREGIERGEVRALAPISVAAAIVAGAEGLLLQAVMDPAFDARAHWPVLWDGLVGGLAA
jgi:AcrR family transcriptional regulator